MNNSRPPENLTWYRIKFVTSFCWSAIARTAWRIGPFGLFVLAGAEMLLWATWYLILFAAKDYYHHSHIEIPFACIPFAWVMTILTNVAVLLIPDRLSK